MQSRKTALATMVITAMARWNRLTTRKVCEDFRGDGVASQTPGIRTRCVSSAATALSTDVPGTRPMPKRSTRSGCAEQRGQIGQVQPDVPLGLGDLGRIRARLVDRADDGERAHRVGSGAEAQGVAHAEGELVGEAALDGHRGDLGGGSSWATRWPRGRRG